MTAVQGAPGTKQADPLVLGRAYLASVNVSALLKALDNFSLGTRTHDDISMPLG